MFGVFIPVTNGAGKTVLEFVPMFVPTIFAEDGEHAVEPLGPQTAGIPPPKSTFIKTESPHKILVSLAVNVMSVNKMVPHQ